MAVLWVWKYELANAHMTYYEKFSLLYLNVDKALKNSTPYCSFLTSEEPPGRYTVNNPLLLLLSIKSRLHLTN